MDRLLLKADGMFPEGKGAPKAFAKDGVAAGMTNELLENGTIAIKQLWKQRSYGPPTKPEEIKAKLGYPLDKYEAAACLVTGAHHLPRLSQAEAWTIGKRINNIIGPSGAVGSKLKALRRRGKSTAPQVVALLQADSLTILPRFYREAWMEGRQKFVHPPHPARRVLRQRLTGFTFTACDSRSDLGSKERLSNSCGESRLGQDGFPRRQAAAKAASLSGGDAESGISDDAFLGGVQVIAPFAPCPSACCDPAVRFAL